VANLLVRSDAGTSGYGAFTPTVVQALALGEPLDDIVVGPSSTGVPYGGVALLVRLHGDPLGFVTLALKGDRLPANDLAAGLWATVGERACEHARRHGCLPVAGLGPGALMRGLPPAGVACPSVPSPGPTAPSVSVIVPTAGRAEELARCLQSLRALVYRRFDVLIVDNRPTDPATRRLVEEVGRADDRVRYLAEERPGSSVARNAGVAHTTAEVVAFTDDDATVEPDWLDWLIEPFMSDPDVDAVTGLVLPAELETQAQRWFEAYGGFGKGFERRVYDLDHNRADRLLYPYWGGVFGSGNSMAFRRPALAAIGGFDPALGAGSPARGGADIEAFSHVILRGGRLAYQPRSICWHVHRRDEAALRRQLFAYGVGLAAILTKWLLRDPRLLVGLARALRPVLRGALRPSRTSVRHRPNLPPALNRLELRGLLLGPALYLRSVLWSRRRRLADVLRPERRSG
jgi:O-antigen biosynthesis protein